MTDPNSSYSSTQSSIDTEEKLIDESIAIQERLGALSAGRYLQGKGIAFSTIVRVLSEPLRRRQRHRRTD
jgi:hypothetical protein